LIAYIDTSAIVPLLLHEPVTGACVDLWEISTEVYSTELSYVETAAAIGRAEQQGRLSSALSAIAWQEFEGLWLTIQQVRVSRRVVAVAAYLGRQSRLRGYDAVQCASALQVRHGPLVMASGDQQLLKTWHMMGHHTYDINRQS
jgi:predicted nucleic acid-binding protein